MTDMFCYQCQETVGNTGCTKVGVCGKKPNVAGAQDFLIWLSKGLATVAEKVREQGKEVDSSIADTITYNLFMTITNANFDQQALDDQALKTLKCMKQLKEELPEDVELPIASQWENENPNSWLIQQEIIGVLNTKDEDIRSLRELITYGIKGMAAYNHHANVLGARDEEVDAFMQSALAATLDDGLTVDDLVKLTLETGSTGIKAMALLDGANTSTYGNPEITEVNIGVGSNPGILISGHDLKDMEMLLEQTKGTGVDVYTHSEMLPANYYPFFKKYDHFHGNYGNAWHEQNKEFASFNGPILMTTNCITPVQDAYKDRIFTTGAAGYPNVPHIEGDENGQKDFSQIIELAKTCDAPEEIENGAIIGGFAHHQTIALADKVVEAVNNGDITHFFVMAGCDGRQKGRSYYTEFAKALPESTVILTAGCAKYRYNKLGLGDINGIPRVLDAGQCNDSYSLVQIALALAEAFGVDSVNELPISYNIAWYEQKAVLVLLALLSLGIKNIHLGPTLPAFISENVLNVLVEQFNIAPNSTVEEDMEYFLG